MKINGILDENYEYGLINEIDEYIRNPNNKWKQERVDKAIKLLDEYKEKKKFLMST